MQVEHNIALDTIFFDVFGAWFNVDLIDIDDPDELEKLAMACAADLRFRVADTAGLIASLKICAASEILDVKFSDATDVDWNFDERTQNILKTIISSIIEEL